MVARSAPTLRFSSVRHRDPPAPPPAASPNPRSKISSFAHDTAHDTTTTTTNAKSTSNSSIITTRRNAIIQQHQHQKHNQPQNKLRPLKQSKLPFSPPAPPASFTRPGLPEPQHQRQPTKTIPAHERPFKKAKLDGRHYDQASITGPAKLPLRSRDSQGLLTPEPTAATAATAATASAASRTRSATGSQTAAAANNNNNDNDNKTSGKTTTLVAPPRLPLSSPPASAITRTTRKSAHSRQHLPPVTVSEDVEKNAVNGMTFGNIGNDNDKSNADVTARRIGGGGGGGVGEDGTSALTVIGREKRSLRSNDGGSRSKSELAMYFQNYEQILSLEPVKPEFLSADTTILLVDDLTEPIVLDPVPTNTPAAKLRGKQDKRNLTNGHVAQSAMDNPLLDLHDAQILDLRLPVNSSNSRKPSKDPLDDDVYFKAHRRIERQEKQLRNIERERAQHEKVQLDRLLDELQGHDWLRVMGISGITETEKKLYEPKRAYFIKEVSALIEKFRVWKEEEKRRKIERDQNIANDGDDEDEEEVDDNEESEPEDEIEDEDEAEGQDEAEEGVDQSSIEEADTGPQPNGEQEPFSPNFQTYVEPPDINDVDAWAARQLHQEAISASSNTARHSNILPKHVSIPTTSSSSSSSSPASTSTSFPAPAGRDSDRAARAPSPATSHTSAPAPTPPPQPEAKPFTSFYTKRHLRDAAVGKIRRGRTRTAFGQPLPEVVAREFRLPGDILTEEAIDACQRKKRRLRRARKT
ncbi:hypothetical protein AJ78_04221 [Emergomyces pasteurianus Ep9510]|uniref:Something about silencing protein 4 domain-containing protein n=1 Tax=Emergomyces pasteurianus Ep9510 TaxID=1447872 RepID=A0A1J9QJY5_9EURO|nr:hypothetical protein AJ78_04221 [Emergomyces pasteurianus Ep9510]